METPRKDSSESEWEEEGMCDDIYYLSRHVPCGTQVQVMGGYPRVCPKCQPEEWAKTHAK